jgi:hypothetical protein
MQKCYGEVARRGLTTSSQWPAPCAWPSKPAGWRTLPGVFRGVAVLNPPARNSLRITAILKVKREIFDLQSGQHPSLTC